MDRKPAKQGADAPAPHSINRVSWPPARSDLIATASIAICVYCVVTTTWPFMAGAALIAAVFAGLSPRMKGRFGLKTGPHTSLGGEFASPFEEEEPKPAALPALEPDPARVRELPPRTESGEG